MSNYNDATLGRRIAEAPRFELFAGMVDLNGFRIIQTHDGLRKAGRDLGHATFGGRVVEALDPSSSELVGDLPDVRDAPTRSGILELARQAYRDHWARDPSGSKRFPILTIELGDGGWRWRLSSVGHDGDGFDSVATVKLGQPVATEELAVVDALESAP